MRRGEMSDVSGELPTAAAVTVGINASQLLLLFRLAVARSAHSRSIEWATAGDILIGRRCDSDAIKVRSICRWIGKRDGVVPGCEL